MKSKLNLIYKYQSLIYKWILFIGFVFGTVYFFPKGAQFKFEFQKGKPWQYKNLYAPFDFAIQKTETQLEKEKQQLLKERKVYFKFQENQLEKTLQDFSIQLNIQIEDNPYNEVTKEALINSGTNFIQKIYEKGFLENDSLANHDTYLRKGTLIQKINITQFHNSKSVIQNLQKEVLNTTPNEYKSLLSEILTTVITPNIVYDEKFSNKEVSEALKNLSPITGKVSHKELIVSRGDIVEGHKLAMLYSLEKEYASRIWTKEKYLWQVSGYTALVALALGMLLLFLRLERKQIYDNNNQLLFIFGNMLFIIFLQTLIIQIEVDYLYVVPVCILPIIIKVFFDTKTAIFSYVLTISMLGFIVPNSFEYIYLQLIAGFVTVMTVKELYKRENLFKSVGKISLIYMLTYFAFHAIHEGQIDNIKTEYFVLFAINGVLSFLSVFLIWFYEKFFGYVSEITLLELSNTNSPLLRELNEKAPGTFQHSMQVANLAESCANEIGANAMLVRTGALYHDIGKMENPFYFTENQSSMVNPHDELEPEESAEIILNHVSNGISLAKKKNLPDEIIDFIRTHHGDSLVYYFYKKSLDENEHTEIEHFKYKGPKPFSKETSILMMCDATEAASKSLKTPTSDIIDNLVENIINKQVQEKQFNSADITLNEIEIVKSVIKKKLKNIHHTRISYSK